MSKAAARRRILKSRATSSCDLSWTQNHMSQHVSITTSKQARVATALQRSSKNQVTMELFEGWANLRLPKRSGRWPLTILFVGCCAAPKVGIDRFFCMDFFCAIPGESARALSFSRNRPVPADDAAVSEDEEQDEASVECSVAKTGKSGHGVADLRTSRRKINRGFRERSRLTLDASLKTHRPIEPFSFSVKEGPTLPLMGFCGTAAL